MQPGRTIFIAGAGENRIGDIRRAHRQGDQFYVERFGHFRQVHFLWKDPIVIGIIHHKIGHYGWIGIGLELDSHCALCRFWVNEQWYVNFIT